MERKIIDGVLMTEAECLEKYSYLVRVIVSKLKFKKGRIIEPDDLYNVGAIGVMKAYRLFDPDYGSKFKSYCEVMARGSIYHFLRDNDKSITFGRQINELVWKLNRRGDNDLPASVIAERYAVPYKVASGAIAFMERVRSMDAELPFDDEATASYYDMFGVEDDNSSLFVNEFIGTLDDRSRTILELRHRDMSQHEIAAEIGCSQMHVSRLLAKIGKQYHSYNNPREIAYV
ncbi:sigma-70 family RNA polymerase sigma factor [Terribacillus saccharophilus]|uniref:sigma-70 family RNA polymerase sigma factor n=1 Tax=Terribacillus saccharophilus TaxID=361277 RepID=UPI00398287BE